ADFVCCRPLHENGARSARALAGRQTGERDRVAQLAFVYGIPGYSLPAVHSRRPWAERRRLSSLAERHLSFTGLHALEGRDHLVGALERGYWRSFHELIQPLCVRVGGCLGLSL